MTDNIIDPATVEWTRHARCEGAMVLPLVTAAHEAGLTVSRIRLSPGSEIEPHDHPHSTETILILSGTVHSTVGDVEQDMEPGQVGYAPPGMRHGIGNRGTEPVEVLAIFNPPL